MALRQIYHHETGLRPSSSSGLVGIPVPNPFRLRFRPSPALPLARTRSELGGGEEQGKAEKGDGEAKKGRRKEGVTLDDVNPVGLGRRSRQIFDEVWRKFSGLGQISRSLTDDDEGLLLIRGPMCEFTVPEAQDTTVLVVGATSRIGRIVVRKLMLRGYKVKVESHLICLNYYQALVRKADPEVIDMLPRSVSIVVGDVGEPSTLRAAVQGSNKIIYCATARSSITGDLNRVDYQGVCNVTKAFQCSIGLRSMEFFLCLQDYNNQLAQLRAGKSSKSKLLLAKFKSAESLEGWEVRKGTYFQDVVATKYDGGMDAKFEFTETGDAVFSGSNEKSLASSLIPFLLQDMFSLEVDMLNFPKSSLFHWAQPLTGALYRPLVWFDALHCFLYRWYCLNTIHYLILYCHMVRYDGLLLSVGGNGKPYILILETGPLADTSQSKLYFARINTKVGFCRVRISLTLHLLDFFLLVFYTGMETDFILVSCTGSGIELSRRDQVLKAKKVLQISAVAHLPDKANNYLTPALSVLEKNT
ncbi:hypothetical protein GW17_00003373 [Ensete ventricosum]|nr:hypothetical protein GW17_00003373 [Ensete ventricosum]